jgi:ParB-like chromosome segregation protein Spo0J
MRESSSLDSLPVESVLIETIQEADSPRIHGIDEGHVRVLCEIEALPPIILHRESLRVIDGMHRLRAAILAGRKYIQAVLFSGSDAEAFTVAVEANIRHGRPLTLDDRRSAAHRIIVERPELSDRAIASTVGLAAKTVAGIRAEVGGPGAVQGTRIGKDGRVRPLDITAARLEAARIVTERPNAPLREIAREAGLSVGTARDVRDRLRRGDQPLPTGGSSRTEQAVRTTDGPDARVSPIDRLRRPRLPARSADKAPILASLAKDPTLRYSAAGRWLLRWLRVKELKREELVEVSSVVPGHCAMSVAALARSCAEAWTLLAETLERDAAEVSAEWVNRPPAAGL